MVHKFTPDQVSNLYGLITWTFGDLFFIETPSGNFVWSNPDYGDGTNELFPTNLTWMKFKDSQNLEVGRDKGVRLIGDYCISPEGENFKLSDKLWENRI